jgi:hypothetical protein
MKTMPGGRRFFLALCLLIAAGAALSCSIPNLEEPECTAARGAVKEFYSYHFGGEMRFSPENLKAREKFLTPELIATLQKTTGEADVFTVNSTDYPKAFRVGACRVAAPDKTSVEVILFWKDDVRSEQKTISVEAVRRNEQWLVNRILN